MATKSLTHVRPLALALLSLACSPVLAQESGLKRVPDTVGTVLTKYNSTDITAGEVLGPAGFKLGTAVGQDSAQRASTVISQSPVANQLAIVGTSVNFVSANDPKCGKPLYSSDLKIAQVANVTALSNGAATPNYNCGEYQRPRVNSGYGSVYQCVEYIRRFYGIALGQPTKDQTKWPRPMDAKHFYYSSASTDPAKMALTRYANFGDPAQTDPAKKDPSAGTVPPRANDIVVFDTIGQTTTDKYGNKIPPLVTSGHVAIVKEVDLKVGSYPPSTVTIVEQNNSKTIGQRTLTLRRIGDTHYYLEPATGSKYTPIGWLRKQAASDLVTYAFTGYVTALWFSDPAFWSVRGFNVNVGTSFSGRMTYDRSVGGIRSVPSSPDFYYYEGALKSFEVTFAGNQTFRIAPPGNMNHEQVWTGDAGFPPQDYMQIWGFGSRNGYRISGALFLQTTHRFLSGSPPLPLVLPSASELDVWPDRTLRIIAYDPGAQIRGQLTSLTRQ